MSAFPKADVQNARVGIELNVRLWPKADIEGTRIPPEMHSSDPLWGDSRPI